MAKAGETVTFNNGQDKVPAILVKDNGDGTWGLFAPEQGTTDVKLFVSVPEGEGGLTFSVS